MADFNQIKIDITVLTQQLHVPERLEGLGRPLTQEDFTSYKQSCEDKLLVIHNRLKELIMESYNEVISNACIEKDEKLSVVHLLILCGEHSALEYWSSHITMEITKKIADQLLQLFHKNTVEELIMGSRFIFKNALLELRPKLLLSTWKCNPAAVLCYHWLLMKVRAPFLNEYLSDVLPTALIITDDFEEPNRLRGLKCITHIVNNVTKADLQMYGQCDVILEALQPILYCREVDLLEQFLVCFVTIMRKMDQPSYSNNLSRNKFDDVVNVILNNLDLEEKNEVKIIYLNCLLDLIKILQLRSLRHSRKLLDMLAREINIETNDYMNTLLLQVLDTLLKYCWPRFNFQKQFRPVIISLFKLIHDWSSSEGIEKSLSKSLEVRLRNTFQLLKTLSQDQIQQVQRDIRENEQFSDKFKSTVDSILK
ncbi:TELO2-interacting protein 2-like isoform X1 [Rhodnius prolixus]|uniref:TELO2-interacting protein 2-like isoform X1 n=1 Tax=Rhodnius prolixus TaxID=13249 RepID=UPI003D18C60D